MSKKVILIAIVLCLSLTLASPVLIHARGELAILDSSAEVEFPSEVGFSLSARSDVDITDIRLRYTIERSSYAQVTSEVYIEFVPDTTVDVSWTLEMVKTGGLPPGTILKYWWVMEDANGDRVETTPLQVVFDDARYPWRSFIEGKITIYWYEGGQSFVQELMDSAQKALVRLAEDTGAYVEKPVRIYVYADTDDLKGSRIYPQEWEVLRSNDKF